jgi:glycosyltransferase involved in cell wall biosynthesis
MMVARRYPPDVQSGTETVFASLYEEAIKHHDVHLVVGYRKSRDSFPSKAVAVQVKGSGLQTWMTMAGAAIQEARRFRPDVILSNSIEITVPGIPTAVIVHDLNFGQAGRGPGSQLRELFYRIQAHRCHVITVSAATHARLRQAGIPEHRLSMIHNGVDLERFFPSPEPPSPPVRFVYPSRILLGKAQHIAIDALGRMRPDQRRNAHLTLVGALTDRLYADRLKLQAFKQPVDFAYDVPDISVYHRQAHVVLFPTLMEEGFGFTAVEGMASGRPVIWSDQPAIREATGGIGIPCPQDDADAFKKAMLRLIENPEERRHMGAEGRRYVEAHYAWPKVWAAYATVLEKLRKP